MDTVDDIAYNDNNDHHLLQSEVVVDNINSGHERVVQETNATSENPVKNNAVWTSNSTHTLLKLYESNLGLLETPKKKTKIWAAISDNLKDYRIQMSPNQVRWKINALTKRYKQCVDSGQHSKFKYFPELNNIYAKYITNCDTYYAVSELIHKKNHILLNPSPSPEVEMQTESKAMLVLRKNRLADKIKSDICQSKVQLEKQWLEYLKSEEEQKLLKDEIFERRLKLREEELELWKRELEIIEAIQLRIIHLKEKEQEEIIKLEREKCEILKQFAESTIILRKNI